MWSPRSVLLASIVFSVWGAGWCRELQYALFTTDSNESSGILQAIKLAEEMINTNSSLLPGYNLTSAAVYDTKVLFVQSVS